METTGATPLSDANELCRFGVAELRSLYASGELSPVEVTRAHLDRAHVVQECFNAFTFIDPQAALEQASDAEQRWRTGSPASPIDGVPATVKDIMDVAGWVIRCGSLASEPRRARVDSPAVQRLRRAGGVLLGLTTTPEFGWKAVTDSPLSGVTRNPWKPGMTAGGSSGGAAVAAATGAGVLHIATDGGGSARIPASFTGTVGFKPTFARIPLFPASAFGTLSHIGVIARSVDDTEDMFSVLAGRDLRDWTQWSDLPYIRSSHDEGVAGIRLGYWSEPAVGQTETEVVHVIENAVRVLEGAGASVAPIALPPANLLDIFHHHWFTGAAARADEIREEDRDRLDPGFNEIARLGRQFSRRLVFAQQQRADFGCAMDMLLSGIDALVSPAVAVAPFDVGCETPPGSGMTRWTEWAGFNFPINLSQQPACVVPCGRTPDGRPIGLQLVGARGGDDRLLSLAREVERLLASSLGRTRPRGS